VVTNEQKNFLGYNFHPEFVAPCQIPGISEQERRQKESEVFDRAIDDLCSTHWQILHLMDFQSHQFMLNVLVKVQHTMIMVMFGHF